MMLLCACCTGFMEADGLFSLEGMHEAGAEQSLVEIREALEYYCLNFIQPWLEEYFYHKVQQMAPGRSIVVQHLNTLFGSDTIVTFFFGHQFS